MDVIIIGSGPAGCAAASTCHRVGLNVLIITDHSEVSDLGASDEGGPTSVRTNYESIHPGVSSLLERIGLAGAEVAAIRSFYNGIRVGNNYTPFGKDASGPWKGMHIDRYVFNAELLRGVQELGVEARFNEEVEDVLSNSPPISRKSMADSAIQGDGGRKKEGNPTEDRVIGIRTATTELYAKYIIDASGRNAIAGRKLKFRRRFFSPPYVCWTGISQCDKPLAILLPSLSKPCPPAGRREAGGELADAAHFIPNKNGWTWLAPVPPDHCAWTRLSVKGKKSLLPPEELKDCTTIGKIQASNRRWRLYRPVCKEGVILCGDAAGILDPAAGQGIFNALWSGMVAAQAVVSCIQQPELEAFHLARYDEWFMNQFEEKVNKLKSYYEEHGIAIG